MFDPVPFSETVVQKALNDLGAPINEASIREVNRIVNQIEAELKVRYIRMEFGIPGLPPNPIALEAEIHALSNLHLANTYPPIDGVPILKEAARDFVKAFMNIDVPPTCCVPTLGALQGGFLSIGICGLRFEDRKRILFLEPSFPVNKVQCNVWGLEPVGIDFIQHRGQSLLNAIEEQFATQTIGAIMYSSPNNPSWICLKENELEGIGRLCSQYQVMAIEDLAYFAMDFRQEYGIPYKPPYQPTVARYTDQYILLISSSKMFSYAGQRVGIAILSPKCFEIPSPRLKAMFNVSNLGAAFIQGGVYATSAGVPQSAQYGFAALLRATVDGSFPFTKTVREYEQRARIMKKLYLENGFYLVYDNDLGDPLADGFYFTVGYPGMNEYQLLNTLIRYGISAISLSKTGSIRKDGIRACVSLTDMGQMEELSFRLSQFHKDYPIQP